MGALRDLVQTTQKTFLLLLLLLLVVVLKAEVLEEKVLDWLAQEGVAVLGIRW
jgi:hypothetical protein